MKCRCRNVQIGPILYRQRQCLFHRIIEWLSELFDKQTENQ